MATTPAANDTVSVARRRQQKVHLVEQAGKLDAASYLITTEKPQRCIVFAGTKKSADALQKRLEAAQITSDVAHGNLSEEACKAAVSRFNQGDATVLVITDKIAEVMKIDAVDLVIGLHLPADAELFLKRMTYLSDAGMALTLVGSDEFSLLHAVERRLKRNIPQSPIEGFPAEASSETATSKPVRSEMKKPKAGQSKEKGFKKSGGKPGKKAGDGRSAKPWKKEGDGKSGKKDDAEKPGKGGGTGHRRSETGSKTAKKPARPAGKKIVVKSLETKRD